jgi:hypothetical protein
MKTDRECSSVTPPILNLCPWWRGMLHFTPGPLYPPGENPTPKEYRKLDARFREDKNRFTLPVFQKNID